MKFWQLTSLLRGRPYSIVDVAQTKTEWSHFGQWLRQEESLVRSQDREKLDAELPDEFLRAVLSTIDMPFDVDHEGWVRPAEAFSKRQARLSAVEAFNQFGGELLEDALEKGCSHPKLFRQLDADTAE